MRINEKLKARKMAGENIVLMPSDGMDDMTRVLSLNESSLYLWNTLKDVDFEVEDVVKALLEQYEVEEDVARRDAAAWIGQLKELNIVK